MRIMALLGYRVDGPPCVDIIEKIGISRVFMGVPGFGSKLKIW